MEKKQRINLFQKIMEKNSTIIINFLSNEDLNDLKLGFTLIKNKNFIIK